MELEFTFSHGIIDSAFDFFNLNAVIFLRLLDWLWFNFSPVWIRFVDENRFPSVDELDSMRFGKRSIRSSHRSDDFLDGDRVLVESGRLAAAGDEVLE